HARHRVAGAVPHRGIDAYFVLHRREGVPDILQADALHVRAEIARPHELDVRALGGDVVAHRAFGDHHHGRRTLALHVGCHAGGRTHEIRLGQDVRRALRMREHGDAGMSGAIRTDFRAGEALVHLAAAGPGHDLDLRLRRNVLGEVLVRDEDDARHAERLDDGYRV